MTVCADLGWNMFLLKDGGSTEELSFREVRITNEVISGTVIDASGNSSPLSGTCSAVVSKPEISLMTFRFKVIGGSAAVVEVFLEGMGIQLPVVGLRPIFRGRYIAFPPIGAVAAVSAALLVDPGDTGTGNGTQT